MRLGVVLTSQISDQLFPFSPGLNLVESFQTDTSGPVLSTDKWLEYRDQVAPDTTTFPVRWPAASQVTRERERLSLS